MIDSIPEDIENINNVLKKMPGFSEGRVPEQLQKFDNQLVEFKKRITNCKFKMADSILNDNITTQQFMHFKNTNLNTKYELQTANKSRNYSNVLDISSSDNYALKNYKD